MQVFLQLERSFFSGVMIHLFAINFTASKPTLPHGLFLQFKYDAYTFLEAWLDAYVLFFCGMLYVVDFRVVLDLPLACLVCVVRFTIFSQFLD